MDDVAPTHLLELKVPPFEFSVLFEDVLIIFAELGCRCLGGLEVRRSHDDVSVLGRAHYCCGCVRSSGLATPNQAQTRLHSLDGSPPTFSCHLGYV